MEKTINLQYEGQTFPVKISYILNTTGSVAYRAELLGSSISTFPYYQQFIGDTEKEAIEILGKTLIEALKQLLEL